MSVSVRILLFVVSLPCLLLLVFQVYALFLEGFNAGFELLFFIIGLVGCYLLFLALTGKTPNALKN